MKERKLVVWDGVLGSPQSNDLSPIPVVFLDLVGAVLSFFGWEVNFHCQIFSYFGNVVDT